MGYQEFLVTKRKAKLQDFVDTFGEDVSCVAIPKEDIKVSRLKKIKKGEHLVALYGDRSWIRAELDEKFPNESAFISEDVNKALFGTWFPDEDEIEEKFEHIYLEDYEETN